MDEVLYHVAQMLHQLQRHDKALVFFEKLIRKYPQSKFIPDAILLLAEYHFNNKEFAKALALYQRLGKFPKSAVYGYSFF
ncbi:MAG: tetratricopeptide repeat protein, partial [Deltaproteobacteria bacterium]|nr:tetratricopeptide repeat protein [Deltaproteobacteria bacterium]